MSHNARNFTITDGTSGPRDSLTFSVGSCGIKLGPATIVALVRKNVDGDYCTIMHDTSFNWEFYLAAGDGLDLYNGSTRDSAGDSVSSGSNFTIKVADGWCLVAGSKATGTANPQFLKYKWSTATQTTMVDNLTAGDSANAWATNLLIGNTSGGTTGSSIDIAAIAVYNTNLDLTNGTIQTDLRTRAGWLAHSPVGMWEFQQASVSTSVSDTTGNGANQTSRSGTTVTTIGSEVDSWFPAAADHSLLMTGAGH